MNRDNPNTIRAEPGPDGVAQLSRLAEQAMAGLTSV